jgi:Animal haem peroxidase
MAKKKITPVAKPTGHPDVPETPQPFLEAQLNRSAIVRGPKRAKASKVAGSLSRRVRALNMQLPIEEERISKALDRINPEAAVPIARLPEEIQETLATLKPRLRSFHGAKMSLAWFPRPMLSSPCADKFGYMSSAITRSLTKLPFNTTTQGLLGQLGDLMADSGRESANDSDIPAGFTYVGQFVDHDITLDVSSSLEQATDANTVHNMRTPALDLDSLYGRGPALDPFLYVFPSTGPSSAIKLQLGTNTNTGVGGPAGSTNMKVQTDFDVPRINNPLNPAAASHTAIIGDPRNDENLIVVQFHQTMLKFHNQVIDLLVLNGFTGDIFIEAKRLVTHHYQSAVVHDFLKRICGNAIDNAINTVSAAINSPFRMPVEFAVAAYRFGHSMVRGRYWVSGAQPNATMAQVFQFCRNPNLPVFSNWVVDFNAFFTTGIPVPVFNKARPIDSVLTHELELLPGMSGLMAVLATRNLRRGLALGLPSGQGMANSFGITPMTSVQLTQGLPANEVALLQSNNKLLLKRTPLWYYVLREAAVLGAGNKLGPVGAKIVADTFARMLKRDGGSYLNASGGFAPMLPGAVAGDFTFADLVIFAGVTQP